MTDRVLCAASRARCEERWASRVVGTKRVWNGYPLEQRREALLIARTSRHERLEMLERYVRPDDVFKINAAKGMA